MVEPAAALMVVLAVRVVAQVALEVAQAGPVAARVALEVGPVAALEVLAAVQPAQP